MLNRLGYGCRETLASLRRNLTLTVAAVLTVGRVAAPPRRVRSSPARASATSWCSGRAASQFIVFMKADATEDQIQSVRQARWPRTRRSTAAKTVYLDKPAAFEEFQRIFRDQKTIA